MHHRLWFSERHFLCRGKRHLLGICVRHGTTLQEAISRLDVESDRNAYAYLLTQCTKGKALAEGKLAHGYLTRSRFHQDKSLGNLLVQMYAKCGSINEANAAFQQLEEPSAGAWNSMIAAYAQNGQLQDARGMFERMPQPDVVSWTAMVSAYAQNGHLKGARIVFDRMPKCNVISWNAMIAAYVQDGHLEEARSLFDGMPQPNVVSWTAMMEAYAQKGHIQDAKLTFDRMPQRDVISWTLMITAYGENGRLHEAKIVFDKMAMWDVVSWNAMIHAYALNGQFWDARVMFNKMPCRTVVTWNAMIQAHVQSGQLKDAKALFDSMKQRNAVSWNTIIQAYAQNGRLEEARSLLDRMAQQDVITWTSMIQLYAQKGNLEDAKSVFVRVSNPDVVAWNAMIAAYAQNGHPKEALDLFRLMTLEGAFPSDSTYASVLDACATLPALAEGRIIHASIPEGRSLQSVVIGTALMNMYSKCGRLDDARNVFDAMLERDVVSWNAMVGAYAQNGRGLESVALFQKMKLEGMAPDETTFISVLAACSHAGLVEDGCSYCVSMCQDYGVVPGMEHYRCFLDLLGRSGKLDEAEELITSMPFWPDVFAWTTLLGACKGHNDLARAQRIAEHAIELDPDNPLPYLLLSNAHAATRDAENSRA